MTEQQPAPGWYPDPSGAGGQRYFDGIDWTQHMLPVPQPRSLDPLSVEERSERLDVAIAEMVRYGGRVEYRSSTQAVIVIGGTVSGGVHIIHFLLTLLTCGLWVFIWILHVMSRNEKRVTITVDHYGNVV